jgi:hypothetical protein
MRSHDPERIIVRARWPGTGARKERPRDADHREESPMATFKLGARYTRDLLTSLATTSCGLSSG